MLSLIEDSKTCCCFFFRLGPSCSVLYCHFLFHQNLLLMLLETNSTVQTAEAFWTILSTGLCRRFFWLETAVLELAQYSNR